jgi:nucleotide-binding universal stress UspA family protein
VHVNQYVVGGRGITVLTEKEAAELVDRSVGQLRDLGVDAVGFVRRATAFNLPRVIIDTARATDADALVLGSTRRRGLAALFGHGVRERVTRLSPFPVLTAPGPLKLPAGVSVTRRLAHL